MALKRIPKLNPKKRYLQIALNGSLSDAKQIIQSLPISDRIIVEAGTPFIKQYGQSGIRKIKQWHSMHIMGQPLDLEQTQQQNIGFIGALQFAHKQYINYKELDKRTPNQNTPLVSGYHEPYVVADLKMMDRGSTEVEIASQAGASAATALGHAPIESLNAFVEECEQLNLDSMIDMMNVPFPISTLRELKKPPNVVILHRGVDEENFNKEKMLPLHEIRRVKGAYDMMIAVAGGDTMREIQSAMFNDADIVVVWKNFYRSGGGDDTGKLATEFLSHIK
ncbi:MAG: orotidine 5'-phosphate decarboxylase [Candidatus Pacebacteria bacterium]|nr:orotidine 5'-phosphate decarboxylase [Candidatus Paceibacterota bacterium]